VWDVRVSDVQPGDIIKVDEGLVWFMHVIDNPGGGRLRASYICGKNQTPKTVKSREVVLILL
jgi:oxalate decarboxylase/phosphoglucose isomerase-like protein (cupin superfamily)